MSTDDVFREYLVGNNGFDEAITEGVKQAILEIYGMNSSYNRDFRQLIGLAIEEGTRKAFDLVFGEDILNAIADGTREALKQK
jgi:hypothetical protein